MGSGPVGTLTGLYLPQGYLPHDPTLLPSYSHLFAVCHRSGKYSWTRQGLPDGHQPDSPLPSLGDIGLRPGTSAEEEMKGRLSEVVPELVEGGEGESGSDGNVGD